MMKLHVARAAACLVAALLVTPAAPAQPVAAPSRSAAGPHASVDLLAVAEAGQPDFWLGLRFRLEPGWHIYWQNPGDSGSAPTIDWHLPDGYAAAGTEWPAPDQIDVAGSVNYGYEGEVVLPARVRIAPAARNRPAVVAATVYWVVCRDVCVPGRGNVQIAVPLSAADLASAASWRAAIDAARARVPQPAPASWSARAVSDGDAFVLTVDTGRPEQAASFFPMNVSQVDDSAPRRFESRPRGFRLTLRKSNELVALPPALTGVVRLPSGPAYVVSAPVAAGAGSERRRR